MGAPDNPKKHKVLFYWAVFYTTFFVLVILITAILFGLSAIMLQVLDARPIWAQAVELAFGGFGVSLVAMFISLHFSNVQQKLFIILWQRYHAKQTGRFTKRVIKSMINVVSEIRASETDSQSEVIKILFDSISERISLSTTEPKILLIEGAPGSGKTKTIELALRKLCTEEEWAHGFRRFRKSIYYYDFAGGRSHSDEVLGALDTFQFKNGMLILDNVHYLPANDSKLNEIITSCRTGKSSAPSILIVVARNPQLRSLADITSVKLERLSAETLTEPDCSMLATRDAENFANRVSELLSINPSLVELLPTNEMMCLFLQIAYMNTLKEDDSTCGFEKVADALRRETSDNKLMRKALIGVSSAFVFSGNADKGTVQQVAKIATNKHQAWKSIRMLEKAGVLSSFANMDSSKYTFHQLGARSFLRLLLHDDEAGLQTVKTVFEFLCAENQGNLFLRWCYSILLNPKEADQQLVELLSKRLCDYETMKEALDFVISTFQLGGIEYLSMRIRLCDRVGLYEKGRKAAREYYELCRNPESLLLLLLSDHWAIEDPQLSGEYAAMEESDNVYVSLSTKAWRQHINMHVGEWDFNNFTSLIERLQEHMSDVKQNAYDVQEVLRRCYFDCYRIFYLQGERTAELYVALGKQLAPLRKQLQLTMEDEFIDFEMKFVRAHRLHYDVLFEHECLGVQPSKSDLKLIEECLPSVSKGGSTPCFQIYAEDYANISRRIWQAAVESYRKAYFSFLDKGDKTAMYIALRLCELDPISFTEHWDYELRNLSFDYQPSYTMPRSDEINRDLVHKVVNFYESFGKIEGDDEGFSEYAAFAYTYIFKFLLFASISPTSAVLDQSFENYYARANEKHCDFNPTRPNAYGKFRLRMLYTLYKRMQSNISDEEFQKYIAESLDDCQERNYYREKDLLTRMRSEQQPGAFAKVFFYYPIVLQ